MSAIESRDHWVRYRISASEWAAFRLAASKLGISVTELVRGGARRAAGLPSPVFVAPVDGPHDGPGASE